MKSGKCAKNVINMEGKRLEKIREQLLLRIKIKKNRLKIKQFQL